MPGVRKSTKVGSQVGKTPIVTLRLPEELTAALDEWAEARGMKRSQAIRTILANRLKVRLSS